MLIFLFLAALAPLDRAERALANSEFEKAAQISENLLANAALAPDDAARAQRIAALAQFYLGNKSTAEAHLQEFFKLEPTASVDEKRSPPDWVEFFNSVKERSQPKTAPPSPTPPPVVEEKHDQGFSGKSLVPFGIGQLLLGDKTAGGIFLGVDLALFGADLALYFVRVQDRAPGDAYSNPGLANALQIGQDVAAFALIGVTIIGIVDAIAWCPKRVAKHVALVPTPNGAMLGTAFNF